MKSHILNILLVCLCIAFPSCYRKPSSSAEILADHYLTAIQNKDSKTLSDLFSIHSLDKLPPEEQIRIHDAWTKSGPKALEILPNDFYVRITPWNEDLLPKNFSEQKYFPVSPAFLIEFVSRHPEDGKGLSEVAYWDGNNLALVRPLRKR